MKAFIVKMLVLFIGLVAADKKLVGQIYDPCMKYDTSRTLDQFKVELSKSGAYYDVLRAEHLNIVNQAMQASADAEVRAMTIKPENIGWMVDHSVLLHPTFVNPIDYYNGARLRGTNKIGYSERPGMPSDYVEFQYKDVKVIYSKIACMNPQKAKKPPVAYVPSVEPIVAPIKPPPVVIKEPQAPDTIRYIASKPNVTNISSPCTGGQVNNIVGGSGCNPCGGNPLAGSYNFYTGQGQWTGLTNTSFNTYYLAQQATGWSQIPTTGTSYANFGNSYASLGGGGYNSLCSPIVTCCNTTPVVVNNQCPCSTAVANPCPCTTTPATTTTNTPVVKKNRGAFWIGLATGILGTIGLEYLLQSKGVTTTGGPVTPGGSGSSGGPVTPGGGISTGGPVVPGGG